MKAKEWGGNVAEIKITNLVKFYTLLLLNEGPKHGYELMREMGRKLDKRVSPGQIYPFLKLLQRKGYVKVGARGEREKGVYSLTAAGKKFVHDMTVRFGSMLALAVGAKLRKCAHCGCVIYSGGYRKGGRTFCCEHCARAADAGLRHGHQGIYNI